MKALELLQDIQEDNSDAENDIELDTDIYDISLHEDNRDDVESESSSDTISFATSAGIV